MQNQDEEDEEDEEEEARNGKGLLVVWKALDPSTPRAIGGKGLNQINTCQRLLMLFVRFCKWEGFRSEKYEARAPRLAEHFKRLALTCADYSIYYNVEDVSRVPGGGRICIEGCMC